MCVCVFWLILRYSRVCAAAAMLYSACLYFSSELLNEVAGSRAARPGCVLSKHVGTGKSLVAPRPISKSGKVRTGYAPSLSTLCDDVDGSDGKSCEHLGISAPSPRFVPPLPPLFTSLTTCLPTICNHWQRLPCLLESGLLSPEPLPASSSEQSRYFRQDAVRQATGTTSLAAEESAWVEMFHDHDLDWTTNISKSDRK